VAVLVIRGEQFAALQLDYDIRWYEGQLADLYPLFAAAAAGQRRQWVRKGIQRALAVGLSRSDFFQFLCFEQTFSPGCLDDPSFSWARLILAEPGKSSAERIKQLRHETIRRLLDAEAREEQEARQRLAAQAEAAQEEEAELQGTGLEDPAV
jgi:hypothetical protein